MKKVNQYRSIKIELLSLSTIIWYFLFASLLGLGFGLDLEKLASASALNS